MEAMVLCVQINKRNVQTHLGVCGQEILFWNNKEIKKFISQWF